MNENSTGNGRRLPLAERARRGLLLSEPELSLSELLTLEQPTSLAARKALGAALGAAIQYGELAATARHFQRPGLLVNRDYLRLPPIQNPPVQCTEFQIERESYRAWRAQCPAELLSPLSHVTKWLGDLPAVESLLSLPEPVAPVAPVAKHEKRQRMDAMNNAIRAAIAVLSPTGDPLPRPHELFEYLKTSDKTKTVIGVAKCNRLLLWIDDNGNEQKLTFKALGARLERIKQDG